MLVRMGKDFGKDVLPLSKSHYLDESNGNPQASSSWEDQLAMASIMLRYMMRDTRPMPYWTFGSGVEGRNIFILYLPQESAMARRWAGDMQSRWTPLEGILRASDTPIPLVHGASRGPNEVSSS